MIEAEKHDESGEVSGKFEAGGVSIYMHQPLHKSGTYGDWDAGCSICNSRGLLLVVRAGLRGRFMNTAKLKVNKEVMWSPEKEQWIEEIQNEKRQFHKFGTVTPVQWSQVPVESKSMTSTWAMEKKTNGNLRGRLGLGRDYE